MARGSEVKVDYMDYIVNKNKEPELFKLFGNVSIIRYRFKQDRKGAWIYIPLSLLGVLGVKNNRDGDLIVFVVDDADSPYRFLMLAKDDSIMSKLRPLLLSAKFKTLQNLEQLQKVAESTASSENVSNV